MKIQLTVLIVCLMLSPLLISPQSASGPGAGTAEAAANRAANSPAVLVELFTSEGCSSCPPADQVLADLDQMQPVNGAQVIALSEHVDYWNHLGWRDPFSSPAFSQRQDDYARALALKDVYTPQMIVDGQTAFVGSKADIARQAIARAARAPKAEVRLAIKTATPKALKLAVEIENVPEGSRDDSAEVMLAITESSLLSNVMRGENRGRKLVHAAVTRKLIRIGTIKGQSFNAEPAVELEADWKRQNLKAVAFVQERLSRHVLGAAAIKLGGE
ncbi:MAG TPA: DUF1223 domain-containing protein [Blastocatellia bacterium]|nr:DUF1223 domain-containing protein [Blastocatellia bacterium]